MSLTAFVTGATSGIGKATAEILAENGYRLIICGRRTELLAVVSESLKQKFGVDVLSLKLDVRNRDEVANCISSIPKEWNSIDLLVNNAGLAAGKGQIFNASIDDWEQMIDTNVKGLLYISRAISPIMIERGSGHIINVSSIAGKESYNGGSVYCGTKHAVEAISGTMRKELYDKGIKVGTVSPGLVDTEFSIVRFKGDQSKAESVNKGLTPLYAQDIAEAIWFMASRPKHVNIADVLVLPSDQASSTEVNRNR